MIELLLVLALMGIIGAIAITKLRPGLTQGKVHTAAAALVSDLQYAQVLAAREQRPVLVIVAPSTQQYMIRDWETAEVYRTRALGPGTEYALDQLSATESSTEVFPTGITSSPTTFTLGLGEYVRKVTFSRAGQIRVVPD